jgi:hypothetical protein
MAEPTLEFDASRRRMTIEFHEPPSVEQLATISARLRQDRPRSVHAMVSGHWEDPEAPDWDDPRQVAQLAKALDPSLETFIFDVFYDTVERQSFNTLGDFSDVLEACPGLQRAFVTGCSTMRKTRHAGIRELHLTGNPLHSSVIPALAVSHLPALEKLVLCQQSLPAVGLAGCLRSINAPRLARVCVDGVPVFEFLALIGTAALQWQLCISDPCLDEVDELLAVLAKHEPLRSGKLQLCSDKLFDGEIAQLAGLGVAVVDWRGIFLPQAYASW